MDNSTVAVVGLGFLGRGIATCLLGHGIKVVGYSQSAESHERARKYIASGIDELVEFAGADSSLTASWQASYQNTQSLEDVADCDFVIESVIEDLAVKETVFDRLEAVLNPSTPIASNTSSIAVADLQKSRKHPERFLAMHWAEPAHATRFLEVVPGELTSDAAIEKTMRLARQCGKDPCLLKKDLPGFIVNRLAYAMYREAIFLLSTGVADADTIDRSFRNACGLWATIFGPFQWIDLTGNPAFYAQAMKNVLPSLCQDTDVTAAVQQLTEEDARGTANGKGYYQYTPEEVERAESLFREHAWAVRRLTEKYGLAMKPNTQSEKPQ